MIPRIWFWLLDIMPFWLLRRIPVAWRQTPVPNLPPVVYTDESGQGWTRHPDWQEPWSEDIGQHDIWKREMRLAYLRWQRKEYEQGGVDLRDYGLSIQIRRMPVPALFPLHIQLADAARRLGFMQLFIAANPEATSDEALAMWDEQEASATATAERLHAARLQVKLSWDEKTQGPCEVSSVEANHQMLTCGPFEGAALPQDHRGNPRHRAPLLPLQPLPNAETSDPNRYLRKK